MNVNRAVVLDLNILRRIEGNDPSLTSVHISWRIANTADFDAEDIDWSENGRHIGENDHLESLAISCFVDEEDDSYNFQHLLRGIAANRSVANLHIYDCNFGCGTSLGDLTPFFRDNCNLHRLEIAFTTLSPQNVKELQSALEQGKSTNSLAHVAFRETRSTLATYELLETLKGHESIDSIELAADWTQWYPILALGNVLRDPRSQVATVELRGEIADDTGIAYLADALTKNDTLTSLSILQTESVGIAGFRALSQHLQKNQCALQRLDISGFSTLDDECMALLAAGLAKNASIRTLELYQNLPIGPEGWRSLQWNSNVVEFLTLCNNETGTDFVYDLATSLAENTKLRVLDVSFLPHVSSRDLQAFSAYLQSPGCKLSELCLDCLGIGDEGATILKAALARNKSVEFLSLNRNPIVAGWGEFVDLLCDKASIARTHSSNHTLHDIAGIPGQLAAWSKLWCLLDLNKVNNKGNVARQKIIETHFLNENGAQLQKILHLELSILPHVMAWTAKGGPSGLTLLHQLLVSQPCLFRLRNTENKKRKRG